MNNPYWIALDVEVRNSPDDCRHCGCPKDEWQTSLLHLSCLSDDGHETIGWNNRPALGLAIGCFWDSRDQRTYFFDEYNLAETMQRWIDEQPLIVTFNGLQFDLPLLRGILRRRADTLPPEYGALLTTLCDTFKVLCASSYDILLEIWQADQASKRVKGLNGLGSIAQANSYGGKTGDGAQAPRDWAAGHHAKVINYCAWDVELTRKLFDQIQRDEPIMRRDGSSLLLPKAGGVACL